MGLDNYPVELPCRKRNLAILDDEGRVDCNATMEVGNCPWNDRLGKLPGKVYGMFGVPCWYRGKYGMWMLQILEDWGYRPPHPGDDAYPYDEDASSGDKERLSLYGFESSGYTLTPDETQDLANWMSRHAEAFAKALESTPDAYTDEDDYRKRIEDYRYLTQWLYFCAEEGDGIAAWF